MVDITRFKGVVNQLTTGGPAGAPPCMDMAQKWSHYPILTYPTGKLPRWQRCGGSVSPLLGWKKKFDNYQAKHSTVSSDPNLNCHQFGDTVAGFSATILGITTVTASKRSLKKFALPPRPSWANVVR